jgi:PAS domain S-box-containing protein
MEKGKSILVVCDDDHYIIGLENSAILKKYEFLRARTPQEVPSIIYHQPCQLALIYENSKTISVKQVVNQLYEISPETEIVILSNSSEPILQNQLDRNHLTTILSAEISNESLDSVINNVLRYQELSQSYKKAQKKYSQIFENTKDGIISISLHGEILNFNQAFQEIVGYSDEELHGMSFYELTPKCWHKIEKEILEKDVMQLGYAELYEKEYIHKDGSIIPIEVSAHLSTDNNGRPVGYWAFVRNISKRKTSEAALRQQLKEVTILQDLTSAGMVATDIDELLQQVTKILGESLYSENFGIFTFDENEKILRRHFSYQTNINEDKLVGFEIGISKGIIGRAYRTGKSQRVMDVSKDPDYFEGYNTMQSEIAVPIFIHDRVYGVINAESPTPGRFTEEDERLLNSLANQISTSIAKIQYHAAQKLRTREISALYETAVATASITDTDVLYEKIYEHVIDLFPLDTFSIVEFDPHDESVKIAFVMEDGERMKEWEGVQFTRDENGLIGQVIREQKPYLFYDLETEKPAIKVPSSNPPARSWLGVPLLAKGMAVGGVSVQSFEPHVFDENHQRLLESLAALLAGVIASARLIEHSQNQISRLEALHDIDLVINSSMNLQVTLNILLDQVIEKLQVDAAVILLFNPATNLLECTASHGFRTQAIKNYKIDMVDGISGKTAVERHIIEALNLMDETRFPYTDLMQQEQFISYYSVPLIAKGQVKGVMDIFNRSLLNPDDEWFNFLETLGGQAAIAIDNTRLLEDLHVSNTELRLAYDKTLEGWSKALDMRDKETEGHTQRVVDMTLQIAKVMGVEEAEQIHIRRGALLHDIGKMGIPDAILLKPGPLSDSEWEIMRLHPKYAYDLLYPIKHLRPALDIPYAHHEHWDGTGYPRHLSGESIPLAARIFSVVDVWDALTSDRPYRSAWSAKKTIDYIQAQSGKYFDPQIVDVFTTLVKNELFTSHKP